MEKVGQTNFKVVQAHDLKPLKNPIHVNRMKRFHHRAVIPPVPQELEKLQDEQRNDVLDLHRAGRQRYIDSITRTPLIPTKQAKPNETIQQSTDNLVDVEIADPPVLRTETHQPDNQEPVVQPEKTDIEPDEFEINKIIRGRYNKEGNLEYLIDWKGYPSSARTYEPEENLNEAAREYVRTHEIPVSGRKPSH